MILLLLLSTGWAQDAAADARPLPRYLDPAATLTQIQGATPAFTACLAPPQDGPAPPAEGHLSLHFSIQPDGRVDGIRWEGPGTGVTGADACISSVLGRLSFPPHDEVSQRVGYTLAWKDRQVIPYPTLTWESRPLPVLFFYLPVVPPSDERDRIRQALGLDPFPPG